MRDNVARIRRLLDEAAPKETALASDQERLRAFEYYSLNAGDTPLIEQSYRARAEREAVRISSQYNWQHVVVRALDSAEATSICDLSDSALDALVSYLKQLQDCTAHGLDSPEAPPAR